MQHIFTLMENSECSGGTAYDMLNIFHLMPALFRNPQPTNKYLLTDDI